MNIGFVYVGRKDCGCVGAVCVDQRNRLTGNLVGQMISEGLIIERVTNELFEAAGGVNAVWSECPHDAKQLDLFEVKS